MTTDDANEGFLIPTEKCRHIEQMMNKIENIGPYHINAVVEIHLQSFPDFFLTFLGADVLKLYYKGVMNEPSGLGFVYIENGEVVGFIVGAINPLAFFSVLLKKHWPEFCIAFIPSVLRKVWCIPRIMRGVKGRILSPKGPGVAEISSTAVLPKYRGKGIGKKLVEEFVTEVKRRGGTLVYSHTDANNIPKIALNKKTGFRLMRTFKTKEGRLMNEYWYQIR